MVIKEEGADRGFIMLVYYATVFDDDILMSNIVEAIEEETQ